MKIKPNLEKNLKIFYTDILHGDSCGHHRERNVNYKGDMHYFRVKNNMTLYHETLWNTSMLVIVVSSPSILVGRAVRQHSRI